MTAQLPPFSANWPRNSLPASFLYGLDPRNVTTVAVPAGATNRAFLVPAIVGKTGTLAELYHLIGTSSGNVDAGVYRYSDTNSRWDRLFSSGSQATPAANGWRSLGIPSLPVIAGEVLYLAYAADNAIASFGRLVIGSSPGATLPFSLGTNAGSQLVAAFDAAFPLPATLAVASLVSATSVPSLLGRIT